MNKNTLKDQDQQQKEFVVVLVLAKAKTVDQDTKVKNQEVVAEFALALKVVKTQSTVDYQKEDSQTSHV